MSTATLPATQDERTAPAYDVFISYSSEDSADAEGVLKQLTGAGLRGWLAPHEILSGRWSDQIYRALKRSRLVLLLLTRSSNESKHVRREIALADQMNKEVVVFQIGQSAPTGGLAFYLSLEHFQTDFGEVLKSLQEAFDRPDDEKSQARPVNWRLIAGSAAAALSLAYLTAWFHFFTNLELYSILSVGALGTVLGLYKALPERLQRRVMWFLAGPDAIVRAMWTAVPVLAVLCALATTLFGTVRIESREAEARQVCVARPAGEERCDSVDRNRLRKFVFGPMWGPVEVSAEAADLPRKTVLVRPMHIESLVVPGGFFEGPLLLLAPNAIVRGIAERPGYTVTLRIQRKNAAILTREFPLADLREPVWLGCAGSMRATADVLRDPGLLAAGLTDVNASSAFHCEIETPLQPGDEVTIELRTDAREQIRDAITVRVDQVPSRVIAVDLGAQ